MLLENATGYDFKMVYFNSDGNQSSMCGNGGRCLTKFALHRGILKSVYHFIAIDGEHESEIDSDEIVRLKMKDVDQVEVNANRAILNTGSPHFVKFAKNVDDIDVNTEGHAIRYSKEFEKEGFGKMPVCIAKTQYSLSDNPKLMGVPTGWTLHITDVELAAGAGFLGAIAGNMMRMPGLPHTPRALSIDVDDEGNITGV